jgi:hypothetical protein
VKLGPRQNHSGTTNWVEIDELSNAPSALTV